MTTTDPVSARPEAGRTEETRPRVPSGDRRPDRSGGRTLESASLVLFVALGFLVGARPISDNSFLTHLATGRLILDQGSVPTTDVYSFTAVGEPWVVQSWLASIVYAALDGIGGFGAVRWFHGILAALLFAGVHRLTRPTVSFLARFGLLGGFLGIAVVHLSPRPLVFGLLGLVAVLGVLRQRWFSPWWLVPILWVWVNTHGSFPLAGVLAVGVIVGDVVAGRRPDAHRVRTLAAVVAGTVAGALNPLGLRLLVFPVQLLGRREALEDVAEWAPWSLGGIDDWAFVGLVLALVVAVRSRLGADWLLPAVVFSLAALTAVRNLLPAALVIIAAAAPLLPPVGRLRSDDRSILSSALLGVGLALLVVGAATVVVVPSFDDDRYPVAAIDALDERGLIADGETRVLARETAGNYLTARYGADAYVFTDDRFDMYPIELQRHLRALIFAGPYDEPLEVHDIEIVVWPADSGLVRWLQRDEGWAEPSWAPTEDGTAVLCRVDVVCD